VLKSPGIAMALNKEENQDFFGSDVAGIGESIPLLIILTLLKRGVITVRG